VAVALRGHDLQWRRWRHEHLIMVTALIGQAAGTGGSSGVDWLRNRAQARWYADLHAAFDRAGEVAA
jgi:tryptophan 2,3-dioxygenase